MKDLIRFLRKKSYDSRIFGIMVLIGYLVSSRLYYFIMFIMHMLLHTQEKIVFCNMKGLRYGDNPMYISEAIHKKHPEYELVWLINDDVQDSVPSYIRTVKYNFWNNMMELASAIAWVDSNTKSLGTYKARDQFYVQTWHGSYGIKKIALDTKDNYLINKHLFPYNSRITDLLISNSKRTSEIYRRAFDYRGNLLEVGSPRNDVFFNENTEIVERVKSFYEIVGEAQILLYAPTFRSNYNIDFLNVDMEGLKKALTERFGGEWYILVRLHPQNLKESKNLIGMGNIVNASNYSNMQELLVAADVLLTDYSSCMFDFITKPKPCFIYAPDLEEYENKSGNYWKMTDLPFAIAKTNEELFENIKGFNTSDYVCKIERLHKDVGLCETGNASALVANEIIDFIENKKNKGAKQSIL